MALRTKIRILLWLFIAGLVISGATAIPLLTEINWLVESVGPDPVWMATWLRTVQEGLQSAATSYPFLFYGTDWLAFGHFVIAIAFIGPIRDPVKNIWVIEFGMIASALVIPFALLLGSVRGIPFGWRLIDCSFGVIGFVALWIGHLWIQRLARD